MRGTRFLGGARRPRMGRGLVGDAVGVGDKIAPLIGAVPARFHFIRMSPYAGGDFSCFDFRGPRNKIVMGGA